jgi:hypothetical protein
MMKQLILVGALAVAVAGSAVYAQSKPGQGRMPSPAPMGVKPAPDVPVTETTLGSVRIPRAVMADGKPLAAGSYQVRLTAKEAAPPVVGQTPPYERWVEFVRGSNVAGREVVSIVPQAELSMVAEDAPPRPGGSKVQMLKGNDYLRVWINRGGTHYLIHLVAGSGKAN